MGQWLPVGAGATVLRSVSWFDGAGATQQLWVLVGWAVLGLLLVLVGRASLTPTRHAAIEPLTARPELHSGQSA